PTILPLSHLTKFPAKFYKRNIILNVYMRAIIYGLALLNSFRRASLDSRDRFVLVGFPRQLFDSWHCLGKKQGAGYTTRSTYRNCKFTTPFSDDKLIGPTYCNVKTILDFKHRVGLQ